MKMKYRERRIEGNCNNQNSKGGKIMNKTTNSYEPIKGQLQKTFRDILRRAPKK